ncbi:hypothetical protein HanRHA438_Chr03g0132331 [Helianthus annuus]|nr:hypothetical protein HanOQP8_Chr03g0113081 [Helianthus annuus]KAJ0936531.1 hypothetical protein HanRHA438_Chr03g0132331 [Helianthus annuus]
MSPGLRLRISYSSTWVLDPYSLKISTLFETLISISHSLGYRGCEASLRP